MNYEKLTSDKVNYLIWRYLQEAGFGQAAARLQHDWGLQHHPDDLHFAKYIGPRGLITLIQYGLKLHRIQALERPKQPRFFGPDPGTDATEAPTARTKSTSPARRFDGAHQTPLSTPLSTSKPRGRRPNGGAAGINGKPRGSLTSVSENMDVDQPAGVIPKSENQMDIDDEDSTGNDNKNADETHSSVSSPTRNGEQVAAMNGLEMRSQRPNQEQQPVPTSVATPSLINRTSTATQVDDIIELAPRTTTLNTSSIKDDEIIHVSLSSARPSASTSWLAVGGSHSGQIWEIAKDTFDQATPSTSATPDFHNPAPKRVVRPKNVINLEIVPGAGLTSLAWSLDGNRLAFSSGVSTPSESYRSVVKIIAPSAGKVHEICGTVPDSISNLAWDTDGEHVAGLSSTSLFVFDTDSDNQSRSVDTEHVLLDNVWINTDTLVVCGSSYIAIITLGETDLEIDHHFSDLPDGIEWSKLKYDSGTRTIAVAAEDPGELAIIDSSGKIHLESAHSSGITDLVDRPRTSNEPQDERILATSSEDGFVKIWRFDSQITLLQTLEMGGISRALAMSFSPSADILAVADWDKVLFWNTHGGVQPRWKWELRRVDWHATQVNGYTTNGINGQDHEIDMNETVDLAPLLMWNEADHSLIFAHKEKIAIIDTPE